MHVCGVFDVVPIQCVGTTRFGRMKTLGRLCNYLTLPDVHLVSLKSALEGLIVSGKFYSAIAAGRAVIFIGAYLALAMARSPATWHPGNVG